MSNQPVSSAAIRATYRLQFERGSPFATRPSGRNGMGLLILDFVPTKWGFAGRDKAWWLDVLEWGGSRHAAR